MATLTLKGALRSQRADPRAVLDRVDAVRERLRMPLATELVLKDAKSAGRP